MVPGGSGVSLGPGAAPTACEPIGAAHATRIGLADQNLPGDAATFERVIQRQAHRLAVADNYDQLLATKRERRAADEQHRPLHDYRDDELLEMRADIYHDRNGFAAKRHAFITKTSEAAPGRHALITKSQ